MTAEARTRTRPMALGLIGLLTLASCQSLDTSGATPAEKTAALAAHLPEWKRPTLVTQFARPRTVQLFAGLKLDDGPISSGATGLATLITRDGYALTASHVLDQGPVSILQLAEARPGQITFTDAGVVFSPLAAPDKSIRIPTGLLRASPVRLVRRFRGLDLSLIHLPVDSHPCFTLAQAPPPRDSTVFSYGSPLSGHSSAGKILRVSHRPRSWKLTTSVPLQRGDSGGPLLSPEGRLLAIISRGVSEPFSREFRATIAIGLPADALAPLIADDRRARIPPSAP